jgi:nucleotide-binding universal stress UspA family protein
MMAQRIVVGVDDSSGARLALTWAIGEARLRGATLVVVHCYRLAYGWIDESPDVARWEKRAAASAVEMVDRLVGDAVSGQPAVRVEKVVVEGGAADRLLDAARDADLLVVGSRGRGGFTGMLLGSVSQHCVTHASCPVVVVHDGGSLP